MIVVMAAGLAANLSLNPLDAVTTVTAQIVTILVGDQEFESAKTLSAFALALTLIVMTLVLNFIALHVVNKYREQYDYTSKGWFRQKWQPSALQPQWQSAKKANATSNS